MTLFFVAGVSDRTTSGTTLRAIHVYKWPKIHVY